MKFNQAGFRMLSWEIRTSLKKMNKLLMNVWKKILLIIGLPGAIIASISLWNYFAAKTPEEIINTPHLVYEWNSNFYDNYLNGISNLQNTYSSLKIINASKELIRNLKLSIYYYPLFVNANSTFLKTYLINDEYISLPGHSKSTLLPYDSISLDVLRLISKCYLFEKDTAFFNEIAFPQPYSKHEFNIEIDEHTSKYDRLKIFPEFNSKEDIYLMVNSANLNFDDYFGLPVKIIVSYEYKNYCIRQVISGGNMYAVKRSGVNYFTLPMVNYSVNTSSYIIWNRLEENKYFAFRLSQNISNKYSSGGKFYLINGNAINKKDINVGEMMDVVYPQDLHLEPFKWAKDKNSDYYQLQFSEDSMFNSIHENIEVLDTFGRPIKLLSKHKYYTRMRGINSDLTGDWSYGSIYVAP